MKGLENKPECERVRNLLDVDRSPEEQNLVLAHIETCPACKKEYEETEAVFSLFDVAMEEPPAELHSRIMQAVRQESLKKKAHILSIGNIFTKRFASVACAAMLCLTLIGSPLLSRVIRSQEGGAEMSDFVAPDDNDTVLESGIGQESPDVPETPDVPVKEPEVTELTTTASYKAEVIEALQTQTRANQMLQMQLSNLIDMVDLISLSSNVGETPEAIPDMEMPSPEASEN